MDRSKHIHLIGIGGTGLSAIARVLLERGYVVSGSDRQLSPLAARLQEDGVTVYVGHAGENVKGASMVVRSSAVPDNNVEVETAMAQGIPVLKRSDFLGYLLADDVSIAVAGSHGKTTTTGMISWMLSALGFSPSFIVGGVVNQLGVNAKSGQGRYFVIEADEYDRMFLGLSPSYAVVTNVEHDHPDCFPTAKDFHEAFESFIGRIRPGGFLILCFDDPGAAALIPVARKHSIHVVTYGLKEGADILIEHLTAHPSKGYSFAILRSGKPDIEIHLSIPGVHNVLNATAAFAVGCLLGLPEEQIAAVLYDFNGTGRRFDVLSDLDEIAIIDDYAHHPTEIRATIEAARQRYPERTLWVVWQPHTYSRTTLLWQEYVQSFLGVDHLIVTEVYAARETCPEDFSMKDMFREIQGKDVVFLPELTLVDEYLIANLNAPAVLVTLSAGNADQVSKHVSSAVEARSKV